MIFTADARVHRPRRVPRAIHAGQRPTIYNFDSSVFTSFPKFVTRMLGPTVKFDSLHALKPALLKDMGCLSNGRAAHSTSP